jgi:TonB-dependent receptor
VVNKFKTVAADADWDVTEQFRLQAGGVWRKFEFASEAFTRDTVVCPTRTTAAPDVVLGSITCSPSSVFGPAAIYGFQATPALSENFLLSDAGAPRGTTNFWVIPNLDAAAEFTKLYSRTAAVDAGNTRSVSEESGGGYLQATWDGELGDMRLVLDGGLRYVKTWQTSSGLNSGTFVTVKRNYEDWLPAFNVAFFPADKLIIRGAYAKTMTRPTLGNLTPGGSVDGFNYRVSYGNPFLDPFRADSFDLAVEWYFADQSLFSVALFKKDVSSFPVSASRQDSFASTGLPLSVIPPSSPAASNPEGQLWTINSIENGKGATFKGVELSLQAPFKFLPGAWANFGGIVNATFVDSSADYNVSGPAVTPGGPLVARVVNTTFFGLSKRAWNATLYYEDSKFSARASATYRSDFLDGTSATGNVLEGFNSSFNLDASIRFRLTEQLEFSLEGINLTDDWRSRFTDQAANRNYEYNHFGRTFLFGVRYKM